jgi:peptidoglycan/LPS O-acetylase OafA/YrhL
MHPLLQQRHHYFACLFFIHCCSGFVLCSRYVNGKSGDISLLEGAIRRFPRIMIPSSFAALLYWAIFHWSPLKGRICHQVTFG